MTETASEITRAYRALPSSTRTAAETLCGPNRPVSWPEILLLVARGMEAERERCAAEIADLRSELYRRGQEADATWLTERERAW